MIHKSQEKKKIRPRPNQNSCKTAFNRWLQCTYMYKNDCSNKADKSKILIYLSNWSKRVANSPKHTQHTKMVNFRFFFLSWNLNASLSNWTNSQTVVEHLTLFAVDPKESIWTNPVKECVAFARLSTREK